MQLSSDNTASAVWPEDSHAVVLAVFFAVACPALLLLLHASFYYPFIADDSFISMRYADRLADGLGLTWTNGERVEGYSNLSWVLATALLHWFGLDLVASSRALGGVASVGALACIVVWSRAHGIVGLLGGTFAATCAALTGTLAMWVIGGLEQPLVIVLLALALLACKQLFHAPTSPEARWVAASALALLCVSRPDGPLLAAVVIAAFGAGMGLSSRTLRLAARLAWPALAAIALQFTFRLLYYRDWIPNTARAKVAFSQERLLTGWSYLSQAATHLWPMLIVAVAVTVLGRVRLRVLLLVWAPFIAWSAYVVFIGGDIFPGRRHIAPLVVLLGFAIASGLPGLYQRAAWGRWATALCIIVAGWQVPLTHADPENRRASLELWVWDGKVIGSLLRQAFHHADPLLAADPAGAVAYYSKLRALDMLGLNDRFLAHHPPQDFGKGALGHELGNGQYVFERKPDLVLLCLPRGSAAGCFRSGTELLALPAFHRDYAPVTFEGRWPHALRSLIYVRRQGRLGARTTPREIVVPGFWLAASAGVATLDGGGRMSAELPPGTVASLELPADCAGCRVHVSADGPVQAQLSSARTLQVHVGQLTHIREVVLQRSPD